MVSEDRLPQRISAMIEELLARACKDPDVLAVILFGSHARGEPGDFSDVDVCLVFSAQDADRTKMAEKRLEYLADFPDLDIQVFQLMPLYVRRRVLKEGKVLYSRNEDTLYDLAYATVKAFEDFRHMYYDYLEEVARGS